ncbi:MAG: hypothetical protein Q9162_001537 [Coniocarpon cinnabarinum]
MPPINGEPGEQNGFRAPQPRRQQSGHSELARTTLITKSSFSGRQADGSYDPKTAPDHDQLRPQPASRPTWMSSASDTPLPTAPPSPSILPNPPGPLQSPGPKRQGSGDPFNRMRATTLNIPGLTKSKVSPDGKISQRDVGSKLVIVMVGLPARGKSYITKKIARYLNWLQHDTKIFNVGERRRVAAGGSVFRNDSEQFRKSLNAIREGIANTELRSNGSSHGKSSRRSGSTSIPVSEANHRTSSKASIVQGTPKTRNGVSPNQMPDLHLPAASKVNGSPSKTTNTMDQSANFFDPSNRKAAIIREQAALDTLNALLDYILIEGGSVGILDATNSTLERRKLVMKQLRERAGPDLNVLFLESLCLDEELLERNIRLKLSGPDYKGRDPDASLADFKQRIEIYQKNYVPLGEYEEKNGMPYVQMIDVGRKVISHQIKGFLSSQAVYYLLNFNLAPRQIWITRHGESFDNRSGNIGGDADLSPMGHQFAQAMTKFINFQRKEWEIHEREKVESAQLSPQPGDTTPPNPHYDAEESVYLEKNFCVWTSMLKRSIETAAYFDEEDFDIKQMRMLNELFAGHLEGMTYAQIRSTYPHEYASRVMDKLHYRYPGPGGEGYLDIINRVRAVIVELERMTDHCLIISHRSVVRVLLAYFQGLSRERVCDLNVPIGMVYCLEPKPYGVDLKAYRYNTDDEWFDLQPDFELQNAVSHHDPT